LDEKEMMANLDTILTSK